MVKRSWILCWLPLLITIVLIVADQMSKQTPNNEICINEEAVSVGMAAATIVNVYGVIGYCEEKFSADKNLFDSCVSRGMPVMVSGMKTHGLLPQDEIDKAVEVGRASGKKIFHDGTGWIEELKKAGVPWK